MQARARSVRRIFEARILNDLFNWELGRTLGKRPARARFLSCDQYSTGSKGASQSLFLLGQNNARMQEPGLLIKIAQGD